MPRPRVRLLASPSQVWVPLQDAELSQQGRNPAALRTQVHCTSNSERHPQNEIPWPLFPSLT